MGFYHPRKKEKKRKGGRKKRKKKWTKQGSRQMRQLDAPRP